MKNHHIYRINKDTHKMMGEWNSIGRVVIKDSKGVYLKNDGLYFHINSTVVDLYLAKIFLEEKQKKKLPVFFVEKKTKAEWNAVGHIVKKNSRGVYSKTKKTIVFDIDVTFINRSLAKKLLRQHQYYLMKKAGQDKVKLLESSPNDIPF